MRVSKTQHGELSVLGFRDLPKTFRRKARERMQREIQGLGYTLVRKKVKNINLRVRCDGSVTVSANPRVPLAEIEEFIQSKLVFILEAQEKFRQRDAKKPIVPQEYVTGERWMIQGEMRRLRLQVGTPPRVEEQGDTIVLTVKDPSHFLAKERQFKAYIAQRFLTICKELATQRHKDFAPLGVAMPWVRIREMKSQWGSCMPTKGIITLNTRLFPLPRRCTDYVILHEFCHFIHPNHSKDFYALLTHFMPDWKDRKREIQGQ